MAIKFPKIVPKRVKHCLTKINLIAESNYVHGVPEKRATFVSVVISSYAEIFS